MAMSQPDRLRRLCSLQHLGHLFVLRLRDELNTERRLAIADCR
jgi:hypothetical protein